MMKRIISLLLALVLLISTVPAAFAAGRFADYDRIADHEAADVLSEIGIFQGDQNGNFNPQNILTRQEAAKILTVLLLGSEGAENTSAGTMFSDVPGSLWSAKYIAWCAGQNIIAGTGAGKFDPGGKLTGVAFGKMLLVALGYDPEAEGYVNSDRWQENIVRTMKDLDLVPAGVVSDPLTREAAAGLVLKVLQTPMVTYRGGARTFAETEDAAAQTVSENADAATGMYYVEFGERYFPGLVCAGDSTAHEWEYEGSRIGRYDIAPEIDEEELYASYLTGGGWEEIMEENPHDISEGEISACLADLDRDGVQEMMVTVMYEDMTHEFFEALLDIDPGNRVVIRQKNYNGGGSAIGGFLAFRYDTQTNRTVLVLDNNMRDGIYYLEIQLTVYDSSLKGVELDLVQERYAIDPYSGSDEIISEIRQETNLYKEDDYSFYVYKANGEYISESQYNAYSSRFQEVTDPALQGKPVTASNPIPAS